MTEPDFAGSQKFMRSGTQYDRQLSFNDSIHSSYESGNNYSNCSSTFNDGDYVEPRRAFGQTAPWVCYKFFYDVIQGFSMKK